MIFYVNILNFGVGRVYQLYNETLRMRGDKEKTDIPKQTRTTKAADKVNRTEQNNIDRKRRRQYSRMKSVAIMAENSSCIFAFLFVMARWLFFVWR